ncbi:hypothetical protein NST02_23170 [Robertmurraya sp. FSL W8-0741]|uniref:hypothetical protein n=1 Tax=Robertmurraya sp. FSL W8-0741 TaxID=2954629 RepID=UPI0030F9ABE1
MKNNQNNLEDKLSKLPTHSMSKSKQDRMHQHIMNALNDVEVQQPEGRHPLMKRLQIGVASAAAIVLISILGLSFVMNHGEQIGEQTQTPNLNERENLQDQDKKNLEITEEKQVSVEEKATEIYDALRNRDMDLLSSFVHSEKGLFLSLYDYIEQFSAVFEKDEVPALLEDNTEYFWGYGDANMELKYTPTGYMDRYLKPDTFLNSDNKMFDSQTQRSDLNERIQAKFPKAKIVEFYKEPVYEDWKSVFLVFEPNNASNWELVAIISAEWTP